MIQKNDVIILSGKSNHGKNRINQHGDMWIVDLVDSHHLRIHSLNKTFKDGPGKWSHDIRRIAIKDDPDFKILNTKEL